MDTVEDLEAFRRAELAAENLARVGLPLRGGPGAPPPARGTPITLDGVTYPSINQVPRALGIARQTLHQRLARRARGLKKPGRPSAKKGAR